MNQVWKTCFTSWLYFTKHLLLDEEYQLPDEEEMEEEDEETEFGQDEVMEITPAKKVSCLYLVVLILIACKISLLTIYILYDLMNVVIQRQTHIHTK